MKPVPREGRPPSAHPYPGPEHTHAGFLHSAAVAADRDELLDVATGFVDEGLRAGDLTLLAALPETVAEVGRRLGERAGRLEKDPRIALEGGRAPEGMASLRRLAERAASSGSGRARVLAEPQYADATAWREHDRYEAASNAVLGAVPLSGLCLYDRTAFPEAVLRSVAETHPFLLADGAPRPNAGFQEPRGFLRRLPVPREPVESGPPVFGMDAAPTLGGLRHAIRDVLEVHVPDEEQRGDLYLAASEVAANAFRHGGRPVSARVWVDGRRIVCVVTDGGSRFDDPLAGFVPAHGDDLSRGGMGLWLARKLWDSVDLVLTGQGLAVRLATDLR